MIDNIVRVWDKYWILFVQGLGVTLLLSLITVICGCLLGFLITLMRMSKLKIFQFRPLNAIAAVYVEIIRGTPILLQLYFFYFMLPSLLPVLNPSKIVCCTFALCLNSAAYVSEVIRAGIQAVDKGQTEAARSLGLDGKQAMIHVVLPQALKNILPALCNEFIMMIKETSLASTFFVGELMSVYRTISGALYLTIEPLIIVGIIYFIVTFGLSKGVLFMEKRMSVSAA
ncbi:MAG: amino acid ABC transporter permease [Eubacteriales bacterium]|nr:amino acid ABC transporter permease [Eubacteriales bacterium]